ncbi:hypothetical protein F4604DRAFT_1681007 [Suillus subluteus]|nr:hypothetical protein F4604DRAFT_1681007 [Suillus subluteus]
MVEDSFSQIIHQLVDKTRQGFLSSGDTLEYMANSTFVDNPTSQSQLARVDEIWGLLQYNCPVIVGSKSAASGGVLPHDSPNIIEKVAGKKGSDDRWLLLEFLLKLILLRELTIASWLTYGIQKSDTIRGNERSSTPFTQPTDVFVSGCGHLFMVFQSAKCRDLWSVLFLNDEGGYLEVPALGDWSVFQQDVITSMGPYPCFGHIMGSTRPIMTISHPICVFIKSHEQGRLSHDHSFYRLVEETIQNVIHCPVVLHHMVRSTLKNPDEVAEKHRFLAVTPLQWIRHLLIGKDPKSRKISRKHIYIQKCLVNDWVKASTESTFEWYPSLGGFLLLTVFMKLCLIRGLIAAVKLAFAPEGIDLKVQVHSSGPPCLLDNFLSHWNGVLLLKGLIYDAYIVTTQLYRIRLLASP